VTASKVQIKAATLPFRLFKYGCLRAWKSKTGTGDDGLIFRNAVEQRFDADPTVQLWAQKTWTVRTRFFLVSHLKIIVITFITKICNGQ
jgi:hypothetical protein